MQRADGQGAWGAPRLCAKQATECIGMLTPTLTLATSRASIVVRNTIYAWRSVSRRYRHAGPDTGRALTSCADTPSDNGCSVLTKTLRLERTQNAHARSFYTCAALFEVHDT